MNYGREESEEFLKTKSCKRIYISHWASKGQLRLSTWVVIYLYTPNSCCSFSWCNSKLLKFTEKIIGWVLCSQIGGSQQWVYLYFGALGKAKVLYENQEYIFCRWWLLKSCLRSDKHGKLSIPWPQQVWRAISVTHFYNRTQQCAWGNMMDRYLPGLSLLSLA